jgi:UDP-N-acetylmuramoyl-L-alanyl-D-glutamate--2,6-diaminopimelate ligase
LQRTDLTDPGKELAISGLTSDSRQVREGYLFAALPGSKTDGTKFIEDAITHGASIILAPEDVSLPDISGADVEIVRSPNPRQDFARIAAKFYKLQPETILAVTGTSGKTSTVSFVQQLWHLSGIKDCASLGTLGLRGPNMRKAGSLTTPDTQSLHAALADLAAVGIDHLAMEASSHGLDQYRLDGVRIKAAAYTNLSRDHLDYHKDMDDYFAAKARLFSEVMPNGSLAVINADDEYSSQMNDICRNAKHRIITFGEKADGLRLISREAKPGGQAIRFSYDGKEHEVMLPLAGDFQVMNALCALALVGGASGDMESIIPLLADLRGVPGRLQLIDGHPKGAVYVDYAHKPAALETILKTLRPHTTGRLVCVFGCGGNRDQGKRALMGQIADELADTVIVTDDNPRYEDAATIRQQILQAAPGAREIADRAEAIRTAVKEAGEGDVIVIAGKGHEEGQIIEEKVYPFNDAEEVKKAIEGVKK